LKGRLPTVHQHTHINLIESKGKGKDHYDNTAGQTKLQVGGKVLLFDETERHGRSRKLSAQWLGLYTITEMDKVNATIARGHQSVKVHINRLKPFQQTGEKYYRRVFVCYR